MRYLLSLILSFGLTLSYGQTPIGPNDLSKRCLKKYNQAQQYKQEGQIPKAEKAYRQVLKKNPNLVAAKVNLARISYDAGNKQQAKRSFEDILDLYPDYDPKLYLAYGSLLMEMKDYSTAAKAFGQYLNFDPDHQRAGEMKEKATFLATKIANPIAFEPQALSPLVNTKHLEYEASFTADEGTMIFTRRINNQEDFYQATFEDGQIVDVSPIAELNTPMNEGAHCISPDGKELIFTFCDQRRTYGGCDLYQSVLVDGKWSQAKNLGGHFNTEWFDSQPSLSGDGQTLYFTSARKGGVGKNDIWYSTKNQDGSWSKPVNAGDIINTRGDDEAPFIHKDGLTLYFSSDGRKGLGQLDLFLARKQHWSDSWSDVQHFPYPINTLYDDRGLKVSLDGETAYFSTDRNRENGLDLYSFTLPETVRPHMSTYLKLIVLDSDTDQALDAELELTLLDHPESQIKKQADQQGELLVSYPSDEAMSVNISHPGYLFYSEHLEVTPATSKSDPREIIVRLKRIPTETKQEEHKPVVLNNIFFESGSAILDPQSELEINYLYQLLLNNPSLKMKILGHTDSVGQDDDNLTLSDNRAKAVYKALIDKGISASRLGFEGKGESVPVADNETAAGRQANRRTEFVIIN